MNSIKRIMLLTIFSFVFSVNTAGAASSSKIGILVFDDFLTSDVTAPIEVFGAATKKRDFHLTR